jgi:hypothetical protein
MFILPGAGERLDGMALVLGEVSRDDDVDGDEQVAGRRAALDPPALHTEGPALTGAGRDLESDGLFERRHPDRTAERRLGVGDRDSEGEVAPLAPEQRVRRHVHDHVEVARRPAVGSRLAASLHADALAILHSGGNPDLDLSLPLFEARALARRARVDDAGPTALAVRARRGQREHALVVVQHAEPVAAGAYHRSRPGPRT